MNSYCSNLQYLDYTQVADCRDTLDALHWQLPRPDTMISKIERNNSTKYTSIYIYLQLNVNSLNVSGSCRLRSFVYSLEEFVDESAVEANILRVQVICLGRVQTKKTIEVSKFPSARTNRLMIQIGYLV
jgi:hypothetical protein